MERYPISAIGFQNFFDPNELILEKVRFEYKGTKYKGRGVLKWEPEKGFQIMSFVECDGPPKQPRVIGGYQLIRESDRRTIRLKLIGSRGWSIAPKVKMVDRVDICFEGRLLDKLDSVIFSRPVEQKQNKYLGSSLYYGIDRNLILTDSVKEEIKLQDFLYREFSMKGIVLDEPEYQTATGMRIKDVYFALYWELAKSHWTRTLAWKWPEAVADSLAILTGRTVQLICREVNRGNRIYAEMVRQHKITNLGIFSPLKQTYPLDKARFARLIEFFAMNSPEASVCRNMFYQMAEATRQKSFQATELLLATILEAALRTLQEKPYKSGKKRRRRLDLKQALEKFRSRYLTEKWLSWCDKACKVQKCLRHRNAHPDWLFVEGNPKSDKWREKALKDMIFLSRFYGFMMLALSGEKDIEPEFLVKPFR